MRGGSDFSLEHIVPQFLILMLCVTVATSFIRSSSVTRQVRHLLWRDSSAVAQIAEEIQPKDRTFEKGYRQWISRYGSVVDDAVLKAQQQAEQTYTLVSYNVLGPLHGEQRKHNYTLLKHRRWTNRKYILYREIRRYAADLYCLQEVTPKTLKDDWFPFFNGLGRHEGVQGNWEYVYQPKYLPEKLRRMPNMTRKQAHKYLGVATFYNKDKFTELGRRPVLLRDYITDLERDGLELTNKADGGALLLLQTKSKDQRFLLVNVHLFWEPSYPDIKLLQLHGLFLAIEDFLNEMRNKKVIGDEESPEIILCGDFNSVPYHQEQWLPGNEALRSIERPKAQGRNIPEKEQEMSAVYSMLSSGSVDCNHPEHPDSMRSKDFPDMVKLGKLQGQRGLRNLYLEAGLDSHPSFTTKTNEFCETIDYMWGTHHIDVQQLLQFPETDHGFKPIPNTIWGSDHMALGIKFSITDSA